MYKERRERLLELCDSFLISYDIFVSYERGINRVCDTLGTKVGHEVSDFHVLLLTDSAAQKCWHFVCSAWTQLRYQFFMRLWLRRSVVSDSSGPHGL